MNVILFAKVALEQNRPASDEPSDEALMAQLAAGNQEAIVALLVRFGPRVLNMAATAIDQTAAEEIVQDVFVAVWRGAASFDPQRGTVRDWLLQIARNRIANELRRRGRRPDMGKTSDEEAWTGAESREQEPSELVWRDFRRTALREAVDALPPKQRQALSLAFFDELTHEQVATTLNVPLGTAKTRVRTGLETLRAQLTPIRASLFGMLLLAAVLGYRQFQQTKQFDLEQRALWLVTSSDIVPLRLEAGPGIDPKTHGTYRARPGQSLAVFTFSNFPPAGSNQTYRVWAHNAQGWYALGTVPLDASGNGRLVVENPALVSTPDQLKVVLEPTDSRANEPGETAPVIAWPATQ